MDIFWTIRNHFCRNKSFHKQKNEGRGYPITIHKYATITFFVPILRSWRCDPLIAFRPSSHHLTRSQHTEPSTQHIINHVVNGVACVPSNALLENQSGQLITDAAPFTSTIQLVVHMSIPRMRTLPFVGIIIFVVVASQTITLAFVRHVKTPIRPLIKSPSSFWQTPSDPQIASLELSASVISSEEVRIRTVNQLEKLREKDRQSKAIAPGVGIMCCYPLSCVPTINLPWSSHSMLLSWTIEFENRL